jgi:hypothetical protein
MALKKTSSLVPVAAPKATASKHLIGDATLAPVVDAFLAAKAINESSKANMDTAAAELKESGFETWLDAKGANGTVLFQGATGAVNVSCKDQYYAISEEALEDVVAIIGEPNADALFSYDEVLKADLDLIEEDKRAAFVAGVQALAASMGIASNVLSLVQRPAPIKNVFHTQRHTALTRAQNLALQQGAVKTTISIAVKKA